MATMKYPIGMQDFGKIRTEGFAYVDKTEQIFQIATTGGYYFLSRPRRFGKSLLISTLEAYFKGKKELFHGLAIEGLEQEWKTYPVLHLDLNIGMYDTKEALNNQLNLILLNWEKIYGKGQDEREPNERFKGIVQRASELTGKRVVILVDEYDKPLLQSIGNDELQDQFRSILKAFYSVLKTQDAYIQFALLTGVTKFSKVSIFSDLNNLKDISRDARYADICGITEEELHRNFDESVQLLGEAEGLTKEEAYQHLRQMYDGYHFRQNSVGLYNPFSVLNALDSREFGSYWFATGTPTFLVELLKKNGFLLERLQGATASADELDSIDNFAVNPLPILYQSGYLTVKDYDPEFKTYSLDFPNEEVSQGFTKFLLPFYANSKNPNSVFSIPEFVRDVRTGQAEQFMRRLQTLFADVNYEVAGDQELYFQNMMFIIYKLMGFYVEVERRTNHGRMDAVIKTADYIYIIETKLDGSAEDALRQIDEKGYAEPFAMDGRQIVKIGVNFRKDTRGIDEWKIG